MFHFTTGHIVSIDFILIALSSCQIFVNVHEIRCQQFNGFLGAHGQRSTLG